jgi:hypothetical protein
LKSGDGSLPVSTHRIARSKTAFAAWEALLMSKSSTPSSPASFDHPEWHNGFEHDPEEATCVRLRLMRESDTTGSLLVSTHMPYPSAGHVATERELFRWVPSMTLSRRAITTANGRISPPICDQSCERQPVLKFKSVSIWKLLHQRTSRSLQTSSILRFARLVLGLDASTVTTIHVSVHDHQERGAHSRRSTKQQ